MQLGRAGDHHPHPWRAPPFKHASEVPEFRRQTLAPDDEQASSVTPPLLPQIAQRSSAAEPIPTFAGGDVCAGERGYAVATELGTYGNRPLPRVSRMWAPAAASTALESQREIWCGAPACGPPVLSAPRCGGVLRRSAAASSSSAATPSSASLRARQRGARDRERALAVEMPLRSARSTCTGGPCTPGSIPPRSVLAARPHDASARRRPLPPRARHGSPGPSVGERPCASGQPAARPAPDKGPAQAGAPE
jgi:hypothetical protein